MSCDSTCKRVFLYGCSPQLTPQRDVVGRNPPTSVLEHCVGLLKQDVADSTSQVCHYILPLIFLGRLPKLCRSPTERRRKRTLSSYCNRKKMYIVLDKLLPYYFVIEVRRRGTQNHFHFLAKEEKSHHLFKVCCYQNPQNFLWGCIHWQRN